MAKTIIIGGGVAGLTAAYYLQEARIPFLLLEGSDRIGGRVKTDLVQGCKLDRGFQVFLTQYPEAKAILDYKALDFHFFRPGAVVLKDNGEQAWIGDPFRDVKALLPTLNSGVGGLMDKMKILKMRSKMMNASVAEIFEKTEMSTQAGLEVLGYSKEMIEQFYAPFYRGIFLENDLSTSRRMFEFVFKMFSEGLACVPAEGMEAIPKQIASHLSSHDIKLNARVLEIYKGEVVLEDNSAYAFDNVIIATDELNAAKLLNEVPSTKYRSTMNMYFTAIDTSVRPQLISLIPNGIVNNVCDMSTVADSYTEGNQRLISISIRSGQEENASIESVISELSKWFPEAHSWNHLKTYDIKYALPDQTSVDMDTIKVHESGAIICGDHTMNGSLNAAMKSGRLAAEQVIKASV